MYASENCLYSRNGKEKGKSYFETKRRFAPGRIRTLTLNGETEQKISKMARAIVLVKMSLFKRD